MLSMSEFYSARALRVSQMVGSSLTEEFAIKSVLKKYPFFFLIMIATLFLLVVSTATRIIEGPTYELRVDQSNDIYKVDDFRNFSNCLWFVLVTLTTVGYGDFTTVTNLGRFMSLMNAVWGNLILSIVILSLQNSLNFIRNEERAYGDILEEKILQELENESGRLFSLSFKYYSAKKEYKMLLKEEYLEEKIKRKNSINHAFLFQRSNTLDEESIRNLDHSTLNNLEKVKVNIAKTKKDLTRILYQKIIQEKRFFSKLKEYRNNFGYLTEDKVLLSQVNKLYDFREKAQEKIGYMDSNIRDIASTLNSIEILLQQKHEESEYKKTLNSNKFKDIMLSSSLKSKSDDKDDARKLNRDTYDTSLLKCDEVTNSCYKSEDYKDNSNERDELLSHNNYEVNDENDEDTYIKNHKNQVILNTSNVGSLNGNQNDVINDNNTINNNNGILHQRILESFNPDIEDDCNYISNTLDSNISEHL